MIDQLVVVVVVHYAIVVDLDSLADAFLAHITNFQVHVIASLVF